MILKRYHIDDEGKEISSEFSLEIPTMIPRKKAIEEVSEIEVTSESVHNALKCGLEEIKKRWHTPKS